MKSVYRGGGFWVAGGVQKSNHLRAGIVRRPEDYLWNFLGYLGQTNNRDNFLSTDFGLKEYHVKSRKERVRRYHRYGYEAGALDRAETGQRQVVEAMAVEKECKKEFKISRVDRFRYRTRHFTDSGIIGSKEFVSKTYLRFMQFFNSKNEKKPKPIKGLEGMYSMKRLSKVI